MDQILLQKQVRDNAKDLQDFCKELKEWGDEMKKKDDSLKHSTIHESEMPRRRIRASKAGCSKTTKDDKPKSTQSTKTVGTDYAAWNKFDADAYSAKVDKKNTNEDSSSESELTDEIDESPVDLANSEKEKGNAFVKKQQWDQAIECYTQAIQSYAYGPIYYANRALCYLKKKQYRDAESDCTTALQLDKTYVKAYQRRAAARENLNQISEAHNDLLKVLEFEPRNKESRTVLAQIEKKLENIKQAKSKSPEQRPASKFMFTRDMHIKPVVIDQTKPKLSENVRAFGQHVVERLAQSNVTPTKNPFSVYDYLRENVHTSTSDDAAKDAKDIPAIPQASTSPNDVLLSRHNINDIQLFTNIEKPPNIRSKKPLKRIPIIDVDLETEKNYLPSISIDSNILDTNTIKDNLLPKVEESIADENVSNYSTAESQLHENENVKDQLPSSNEKKDLEKTAVGNVSEKILPIIATDEKVNVTTYEDLDLPIPKTAVQFYKNWKSIHDNKDWRKSYLLKIKPSDLPVIFKESLESKVFSEMLETIGENISAHNNFYEYLVALTQVKRFGALTMFMSSKDKKCVSSIIHYLEQDNNKYTKTDFDNIIKLYEL